MQKWEKLKSEILKTKLEETPFVRDQVFYYWKPITLTVLTNVLKITKNEMETIWQKTFPHENIIWNDKLAEPIMQSLLLEKEYMFEKKHFNHFYDYVQFFGYPQFKSKNVKKSIVVTVMGHVNHGKTTLLDMIRNSNLINQEHGKITQKIGAYQVDFKGNKLTFIDTPGHELFTNMRERGVKVTDLVILVVAANEGVKQQTIEAIKHAQNAKVPIVVFINKIDLENINPEHVIQQLSKYDLIDKNKNGDTHYIKGSCLQKKGIEDLLDIVVQESKKINLMTDLNHLLKAVVIDSYIDKQGIKTAVIIQKGILEKKQAIIVDDVVGKVKDISDDLNLHPKEATPGQCVVLLGLNELVSVGSTLYGFPSEKLTINLAKETALEKQRQSQKKLNNQQMQDNIKLFLQSKKPEKKINIIIKVESKAMEEILQQKVKDLLKAGLIPENIELNFINISFGEINFNDIKLAETTKSQILTFNLKLTKSFQKKIQEKQIKYQNFYLLHELFEYLEELCFDKNKAKTEEIILGKAKIIKVFHHSKLGTIAGCVMESGVFQMGNHKIKIMRENNIIGHNIKIKSLQQEKTIIQKTNMNQEFGIILFNFTNLAENDQLFQYQLKTD